MIRDLLWAWLLLANVFDTDFSYRGLIDALRTNDPAKFLYTVEFFPEEPVAPAPWAPERIESSFISAPGMPKVEALPWRPMAPEPEALAPPPVAPEPPTPTIETEPLFIPEEVSFFPEVEQAGRRRRAAEPPQPRGRRPEAPVPFPEIEIPAEPPPTPVAPRAAIPEGQGQLGF